MTEAFLREGITGFFDRHDTPLPEVRQKDILRACHAVARDIGWAVAEQHWSATARNFHWVRLTGRDGSCVVLFNAHFPIVAFSPDMPGGLSEISFAECRVLADAFVREGIFSTVPLQELERPVEPADLERLGKAERAQAAYWKPRRVGEIIFNDWD